MAQAIARIFFQFLIVLGAMAVFVAQSDVNEAALIFIYPAVLGIPGALASLLVLAPLEAWLDRRGKGALTYFVSPAAGALVPWLILPMAGNFDNFIAGMAYMMPAGAAWGLLWALTRPIWRKLFAAA